MSSLLPTVTGTDVCDFCSSPDVSKVYDAKDFTAPDVPVWGSRGAWVSCEPCALLVDQRDWPGLASRAADCFSTRHGISPSVRDELRAMLLRTYLELGRNLVALCVTLLLTLAVALPTHGQETQQPKFWTTQQVVWQSINLATGVADAAITCRDLSHAGWQELTAPTQTCAGVVGWTMGGKGLELGVSYLFAKHGHPKIALAIPRIAAGASGVAITFNVWPRHSHPCRPNWPCN